MIDYCHHACETAARAINHRMVLRGKRMGYNNIRVLIVDDHTVVRKGIRHIISFLSGIVVVAEADDGEEALLLCQQLLPDVVLMDIQMQGMGGVAATIAIRQTYPQIKVIGLSSFQDKALVIKMLQAQANGYLLKSISAEELAQAIRDVHRGETVVSPVLAAALTEEKSAAPAITNQLSTQQRKVLALLVQGFSNTEIANQLHISQPTARYHVSAILLKLGVTTRVEAAAQAIKLGLLEEAVG